jgi:hypothetical protein
MWKLKGKGRDANSQGRRKVLTNPRWFHYAKGSPREGQAPWMSNSIESCGPSPRASGAPLPAPLPAPLGHSPPSSLSSFRPKRRVPCSLHYTVVAAPQTRLMWSRKTLALLDTTTMAHARVEGVCGYF